MHGGCSSGSSSLLPLFHSTRAKRRHSVLMTAVKKVQDLQGPALIRKWWFYKCRVNKTNNETNAPNNSCTNGERSLSSVAKWTSLGARRLKVRSFFTFRHRKTQRYEVSFAFSVRRFSHFLSVDSRFFFSVFQFSFSISTFVFPFFSLFYICSRVIVSGNSSNVVRKSWYTTA